MTINKNQVPDKFGDLILNRACKEYTAILERIMAADLRCIILEWGDRLISSTKEGKIEPNFDLDQILTRLIKLYQDPVNHEIQILNLPKEIKSKFKKLGD